MESGKPLFVVSSQMSFLSEIRKSGAGVKFSALLKLFQCKQNRNCHNPTQHKLNVTQVEVEVN